MRAANLAGLLLCAAATVVAGHERAQAQDYPDRPIKVVVPFAAGGAGDVIGRLMFSKIDLGQPVVFENAPGAGGNIGTSAVARSAPDGYTILLSATGPLAVNKFLAKQLPYDPERDFAPISLLAVLPNVITVTPSLPVKSLQELISYAKANPGKLSYASVGLGSSQHLAGLYFQQLTGAPMTHVPYRAAGQLVKDLVSGTVPLSFQNIPNVVSQARSEQLRLLAITAKARHPSVPDVPTTAELGMPGILSEVWFAMVAPRDTPRPVIDKLNRAVAAAMQDADLRKRLIDLGAEPSPTSPEGLRDFMAAESRKWKDVVTKAGIEAK